MQTLWPLYSHGRQKIRFYASSGVVSFTSTVIGIVLFFFLSLSSLVFSLYGFPVQQSDLMKSISGPLQALKTRQAETADTTRSYRSLKKRRARRKVRSASLSNIHPPTPPPFIFFLHHHSDVNICILVLNKGIHTCNNM